MGKTTPIQAFRKIALDFLPQLSPWPGLPNSGYPLKMADGDDGDLKIGFPLSGPRFIALGDGTVLDTVTGRMWVADPDLCPAPIAIGGVAQVMNWEAAIDACLNLDYAGYTDWKLPNIVELTSLFFINPTGQQIDLNFFSVKIWFYWASTTWCEVTSDAWLTEFLQGFTHVGDKASNTLYVLPVRGGPKLL